MHACGESLISISYLSRHHLSSVVLPAMQFLICRITCNEILPMQKGKKIVRVKQSCLIAVKTLKSDGNRKLDHL